MRKLLSVFLAAGCLFGMDLQTPGQFHEHPAGVTPNATVDAWWDSFGDSTLSGLVRRALQGNLDLAIAEKRVLESRAQRRIARAALLPSVNNTDSASRIRGGFEEGNIHVNQQGGGGIFVQPFESNLFQLGFDASWEIDLFGGRRHELRAATAEVRSAEESRRAVLVTLLGDVARTYMELRGLQDRMQIVDRNLALQRDSLHLTEVRANAGLATQFDVERQREQVAATEATMPQLAAEISAVIHAESVLVGEQPAALEELLGPARGLAPLPATISTGVPGSLLDRRPDLRRASQELIAAGERVGAAKADLFPKIQLTGAVGRQSSDLSGLSLGAGNFFSLGPSVTIPIFSAGRIRGNIEARKQLLAEAEDQYRSTLLGALRETEDALSNLAREQERAAKLQVAVEASKQAEELSHELYTRGLADFLSVLEAQREELGAEDALAQSETALRTDVVALYKALGGGWQSSVTP